MKLLLAAALAVLAAPSFADTAMMADDAMKLTCKDMMAMDSSGMMTAATAINIAMMGDGAMATGGAMADTSINAMADTAKTDTAMADGAMMSDEDVMKAAEAACAAHPDAMVMDAMKM